MTNRQIREAAKEECMNYTRLAQSYWRKYLQGGEQTHFNIAIDFKQEAMGIINFLKAIEVISEEERSKCVDTVLEVIYDTGWMEGGEK